MGQHLEAITPKFYKNIKVILLRVRNLTQDLESYPISIVFFLKFLKIILCEISEFII